MDHGTTGTDLGQQPAVDGSTAGDLEGFLDRAADQLTQAALALDYSSRQEAQFARSFIGSARVLIEDARLALRERQRSGEAPHGEAPRSREESEEALSQAFGALKD